MDRTVDRYLASRTFCDAWPLHGASEGSFRSLVVIPCLGEYPGILRTLEDLAGADECDATAVIVVVNNRADASADDVAANAQTLEALAAWDAARLRVAWVDASTPGNELPKRQGVGMARKLGLDWGLRRLAHADQLDAPLVCLDGDTRVDGDYLTAIHRFFEGGDRWAAVLPYAHPVDGSERERAAILCYEFFLRYHADQLAWAGSPYGYHAIGSAMACTGRAYAAISGMNRRQAGEDFYFLQQLRKTGDVALLSGTTVCPSGRPSHRVPFGTGRRVQRFLAGEQDEYTLYSPESYDVIRRWIDRVRASADATGEALLTFAETIHPELHRFLADARFAGAWDGLRQQAADETALVAQFHRWFDGFRTLKLIHHLRDTVSPDVPMFDAIAKLLERRGVPPAVELTETLVDNLPSQEALLRQLREMAHP